MVELGCLVERSREGDLDAFTEVVRRFQGMAHGYAYSILGDFHLAQDTAQEAFVEAYYKLGDLRAPSAFPGWFRRIVFKHCDRVTRKRRGVTVPLNDAIAAPPRQDQSEMREAVLRAIRSLPERQREATTLYYIDGYSQAEIAEFLEVPVTTVQKRLHDSRKRLKERMADMVGPTLKDSAPDERFSRSVIAELLARPNLLLMEGHPVKQVFDAVRAALPEYEWTEGDEVIEESDPNKVYHVEVQEATYHVDSGRVLRTSTTPAVMRALAGRTSPVRLITAGRAFRAGAVNDHPMRSNVFHQLDVLHIDVDADRKRLRRELERLVTAALGSVELEWTMRDEQFPGYADSADVYLHHSGSKLEIAGGGMLANATLAAAGFDPEKVSGFGFGVGLERLTMRKLGLDSIHALYRPPYVG